MTVMKHRGTAAIKNERGTALVITLLLLLLVTALGLAAVMMGITDVAVSGSYYKQKQAELTTDGGVELAESMIFANTTSFLPGTPKTGFLPVAILSNWSTFHRPIKYTDNDINVQYTIKYKRQDNVNYYTGTTPHSDPWVRYGADYQYASAPKAVGTQAVYTVTVTDNKTGAQSTADLVTAPGFVQAGAVFVMGNVYAMKFGLATDERIELVSTTPSLPAITVCSGSTVYIQNITSKTTYNDSPCSGTPSRGNDNRQYTMNAPPAASGFSETTDYGYAASQVIGTDGKDYVCKSGANASSHKPITGSIVVELLDGGYGPHPHERLFKYHNQPGNVHEHDISTRRKLHRPKQQRHHGLRVYGRRRIHGRGNCGRAEPGNPA